MVLDYWSYPDGCGRRLCEQFACPKWHLAEQLDFWVHRAIYVVNKIMDKQPHRDCRCCNTAVAKKRQSDRGALDKRTSIMRRQLIWVSCRRWWIAAASFRLTHTTKCMVEELKIGRILKRKPRGELSRIHTSDQLPRRRKEKEQGEEGGAHRE